MHVGGAPLGSLKNIVHCSPGCPARMTGRGSFETIIPYGSKTLAAEGCFAAPPGAQYRVCEAHGLQEHVGPLVMLARKYRLAQSALLS